MDAGGPDVVRASRTAAGEETVTSVSREEQIDAWLAGVLGSAFRSREPASEDASFRRYLRVRTDGPTFVLMDAPPENEDCRPFVHVNGLLRAGGLPAPQVHAADVEHGLLLLEDLGNTCLLDEPGDALVDAALALLVRMQARVPSASLDPYDAARLRAELELFTEWLLPRHLGLTLGADDRAVLEEAFTTLVAACLEQPQVFVHRDYHSRNLMVTPRGTLAIIDHQGAVRGPLAYDLVSLARDVYLRRDPPAVHRLAARYAELAATGGIAVPGGGEALARWVDLTGAQRHLKIAGIFARLHYRDGKARYLADIPLTLEYLAAECAARHELAGLGELLTRLDVAARVEAANERAGAPG